MEKHNISYERVNHLLAISAGYLINELAINTKDFIFTLKFSDYVKSQLHLNMLQMFNRDIKVYKNAYDYLNGDARYEKQVIQVIKYFYSDIIGFLRNNPNNLYFEVITDIQLPKMQYINCDYKGVYDSMLDLLSQDFKSFGEAESYYNNHKQLHKFIPYFNRVDEIAQKIDSYCAIYILANYGTNKIISWEVAK